MVTCGDCACNFLLPHLLIQTIPIFCPLESLRDIARNSAMLGIFSLGAAVVGIAGGIDLSSGSMIALSGTVCSVTMLALAPTEMMAFKPVGSVVVFIAVSASLVTGFFVGTLPPGLLRLFVYPIYRDTRNACRPSKFCEHSVKVVRPFLHLRKVQLLTLLTQRSGSARQCLVFSDDILDLGIFYMAHAFPYGTWSPSQSPRG